MELSHENNTEVSQDDNQDTAACLAVDLEEVDPGFENDGDSYLQSDVNHGINQLTGGRDAAIAAMKQIKGLTVELSEMAKWYRDQLYKEAITTTMTSMRRVHVNPEYLLPSCPDSVVIGCTESHVDALVMVPNSCGLDAILPATRPESEFRLSLSLCQWKRKFRAKYARLGFNPKQAMFYIGRCREEDVWFALADTLPEDAPINTPATNARSIDTLMPVEIRNMMLMFFAYTLETGVINEITVSGSRYPEDIHDIEQVKIATDLL